MNSYSRIEKRMKSMVMSVGFVTVLTFVSLASAGNSEELRAPGKAGLVNATCSTATLNGTYGFYSTGNTSNGEIARIGIVIYDGNGNWTGRTHTSRNGKFESAKFSGQTQVAADCSIKVFDGDHQLSSGIIVDDGNEVFLLNRTSGSTVIAVHRKIHK